MLRTALKHISCNWSYTVWNQKQHYEDTWSFCYENVRFDIPAISIITALRLYEFDLTCFVFLNAKSIYATFTSVECSLGNLVPSERWTVLSGVGRWLFIEVCLLWNFRLARWFHYLFCEKGMTVQSAGAHDEFTVPIFYIYLISEMYINDEKLSYDTLFCFISYTNVKLLHFDANLSI